ncbi:MAG: DNA adenine methylase [Truepera sp.]|nr:DNA adenine methylase [Truepera sp.]
MNPQVTVPARPPLRYHGGKWNLAPWIIRHFPPHGHYVEPFGGGASVLLRKPRSALETYNDLEGEVVNFFRVLRERPKELARAIDLTPYARQEYLECIKPTEWLGEAFDPLEQARRFFVASWLSLGANGRQHWRRSGWRYLKTAPTWHSPAVTWCNIDHLARVAERLKGVQIECKDALDVLRRFDSPQTLFYLDPPYVASTRNQTLTKVYAFELSDAQHRLLLLRARALEGYCLISGYASPLYQRHLERYGWQKVSTQTTVNGRRKVATECLWLSPRTAEALNGGLFAGLEVRGA